MVLIESDILLVIIITCLAVSKLLKIIGQIFAFGTGVLVFNTVVRGESLNSGPGNLTLKKLEESLYCVVLIYWQIIISFCHNARV